MKSIILSCIAFAMQVLPLAAATREGFSLRSDLAQYKGSDYQNVVRVERGISLDEAFDIAENDPEIDYFVYLKGWRMVLEIPPGVKFDPADDPFKLVSHVHFVYDSGKPGAGYCRIFKHGDVVFFKNEGMWLGTAPGLADTYVKETMHILPVEKES